MLVMEGTARVGQPALSARAHTWLQNQGYLYAFAHIFDRVCYGNQIEHRLNNVSHPSTIANPVNDFSTI